MLKQFPRTHLVAACGFAALAAVGLMLSPSSEVEAQRVSVSLNLEDGKLEPIIMAAAPDADQPVEEVTSDTPVRTAASEPAQAVTATAPVEAETELAPVAARPQPAANARTLIDVPPELDWQSFTVKSGDTLSTLFGKAGFNDALMYKVIRGDGEKLAQLFKGDELRFGTLDGELQEVVLVKSRVESLHTRLTSSGYVTKKEIREPDVEFRFAAGVIDNSLFLSAREAGLDSGTTMELAGIFGWDIDFVYDIRKGDRFDVLYEKHVIDGEYVGNGRILATNFVNQGRKITAILYTDEAGRSAYYTPEGKSIQKAFLRAPIDARISSSFNLQRRHPVLNVVRPHEGTDYAAATGSPIMAAGDGTVRFAGWKGGYGRTVILQHGNGITTLYAHLSKLGRGISTGKSVKQGQTIGHVGSSGMVTGPHLHYEFRVNGAPRNSRTVDLPDAAPVPKQEMAEFKRYANRLVAQLESKSGDTQLALANDE